MKIFRDKPLTMAMVDTTDIITPFFEEAVRSMGLLPKSFVYPFETIREIATEKQNEYDILLCRSGMTAHLQENVSKPVVPIAITLFDVLHSINTNGLHGKTVAFFSYKYPLQSCSIVEDMTDCKLLNYPINNIDDIERNVITAKHDGANCCIGTSLTKMFSNKYNIQYFYMNISKDTIFRAIVEAKNIIEVQNKEHMNVARLNVVFDSIQSGIVVTDEKNDVIIYNNAAKNIYKVKSPDIVGKNIDDVIPDNMLSETLIENKKIQNVVKKIHGSDVVMTNTPVLHKGEVVGVVSMFDHVADIQDEEQDIRYQLHSKGLVAKHTFDDILTRTSAMEDCKKKALHYAASSASVVVEGESGTGKELFAQSIHRASKRSSGPFVAINCASIPENLLESELFGYEGGSFTGARKEGRAGLFEQAHRGTIFLDEVGEIPGYLQSRLLRVLQEKEIRRIGGSRVIPIDVRVVSATNKNLLRNVESGCFRSDLYYRLNVLYLHIPPLRERKNDIPLFLQNYCDRNDLRIPGAMIEKLSRMLSQHSWPGNIRELFNVFERFSMFVSELHEEAESTAMLQGLFAPQSDGLDTMRVSVESAESLREMLRGFEQAVIVHMLAQYDNNYERVANRLKVSRTSLWRKARNLKQS